MWRIILLTQPQSVDSTSGYNFGSYPYVEVQGSGVYVSDVQSIDNETIRMNIVIAEGAPPGNMSFLVYANAAWSSGFAFQVRAAAPITVSQSPSILNLSTGDTNKTITTTISPSSISATRTFNSSFYNNPHSNCSVSLSFSNNSGTGSVNSTVTAGTAGCSGVFDVVGTAGSNSTTGSTRVRVPPQIIIKMLVGEASVQGDTDQMAIAVSARNRFGSSDFPGGPRRSR